ncbi:MAG: response regulator transcription factor [Chloroflexaceae bacterium]|nr:response regulator transcription factor [Chloroflexaceae bacterium]
MIQYQQFVLKGREHQETDDDLTHGKGESMDAHILVVEDDHDALRKIAYRLEYEGYRVTRASSGEAAIDLIEAHVFDVVLTDIVMEAVDGLEVMHTARQMNYRPAVILLTGHGSLESCIEALRSGAYDYLLKPCSPEQLLACVSGAVRRHQAEQQLQQAASILMGTIPKGSAATPSDIPAPMPSSGPPSPRIHQSMQIGKFTIGHSRHDVWFGQQPIRTTPIEYALLCYLAEHLGKQCHCCDIVRYTHGLDAEEDDAYSLVKSHIQNLRKKTDRNYFLKAEGKSYMLINPELSPALTTSHDHDDD